MAPFESFGRASGPTTGSIDAAVAIRLLEDGKAENDSLLAYGNGRSYGDTCQNSAGALIDMRRMNGILDLDPETGVLEAEAGAMLGDIIAHAAPHGFFPAVVPGTQFVTLGGAIANDVHGKNHHLRGTFGRHVEALTLLRSGGRLLRCSGVENPELFAATIGGMGLTGLILSASIRLMRVASPDVNQSVRPFGDLPGYFAMAQSADADNEYAVAWLDQIASGRHAGRGLLITGNHAQPADEHRPDTARSRLAVPIQPPVSMLNRPFLTLFNAAYRWRTGRPGVRRAGYQSFFFPLDGVRHWNRLYGPTGLFQHQSVIPTEAAERAVPALLAATHRAGQGSFLTVLKRFGSVRSPGLLSFPRPGYTLTLDFPNHGEPTLRLLRELDAITVDAGGAVNPYKDARMGAAIFGASFPNWRDLEAQRDPAFVSDFWKRTALRLEPSQLLREAAE